MWLRAHAPHGNVCVYPPCDVDFAVDEEYPANKRMAKLSCGHIMCQECLDRVFAGSKENEALAEVRHAVLGGATVQTFAALHEAGLIACPECKQLSAMPRR